MSCPSGAQELPCSAYYITELQRTKLVKNETNFRREWLFRSPGSHACIFFSHSVSFYPLDLLIHLLLCACVWLNLWFFSLSSLILYFYDVYSCFLLSSWIHKYVISKAPSVFPVCFLFFSLISVFFLIPLFLLAAFLTLPFCSFAPNQFSGFTPLSSSSLVIPPLPSPHPPPFILFCHPSFCSYLPTPPLPPLSS